jgi:hypothetical protein
VRGDVLALDAVAAPGIIHFRPDQADSSLTDLLAPLAESRPSVALGTIAQGSTALRVASGFDIRAMVRQTANAETDEVTRTDEDPIAFEQNALIGASAAVRDAHGLIHRFAAPPVPPSVARTGIDVPLAGADGAFELVSLDLSVGLPAELIATDGSIRVVDVQAVTSDAAAPARIDLGAPETWRISWLHPAHPPVTLPHATDRFGVVIGGDAASPLAPAELDTPGTSNPVTISMQPRAVIDLRTSEIPVLVSQSTLVAMNLAPADTFDLRISSVALRARIAGVFDSFPTTNAAAPVVVVDLQTLGLQRFSAAHAHTAEVDSFSETRPPDEWWLEIGTAQPDELERTLAGPPFISTSVATAAGRERSLVSDPVALGIIGALGLGALAAGLFALIGLAVAASVSARERQTEFALLRALGLSRGQLASWLWLENGSLAVVSLLAGVALGAVISLVVLPSVTLTATGLPPTPPVMVTLPLATIAALAGIAAVALVVVVIVMTAVLRRMRIGNILRMSEE